jgi:hypothetical protein
MFKTIILSVVLYGHETWSLTLMEEFGNRVLRRIFGPKRDEVTGWCRKLHNEELHNLYSPSHIIIINSQVKVDDMDMIYSTNGEARNAYRLILGNQEEKRPLGGRSRRRVSCILWGGMD